MYLPALSATVDFSKLRNSSVVHDETMASNYGTAFFYIASFQSRF